MKRLLLVPLLLMAACGSDEETKEQPTAPTASAPFVPSGGAGPTPQQHSNSDWLMYFMFGYMLGSPNQRVETRYVPTPSPSTAMPFAPSSSSPAPSYAAPKPSTPASAPTPSRSAPTYSSSTSSRSYSSGSSSSSSSSYSGSRSSGGVSYSSGGRR